MGRLASILRLLLELKRSGAKNIKKIKIIYKKLITPIRNYLFGTNQLQKFSLNKDKIAYHKLT